MTPGNFKNINNHDKTFLHIQVCIHKMLLLFCKIENDLTVTNSEVSVTVAEFILGYVPLITLSRADSNMSNK